MTSQGPMLRAVAAALRASQVQPQDRGAQALARRYAALMDEAAPKAAYEKHLRVVARAVSASDDPLVEEAFGKIAEALAAHSVASDLGPKLLAVLAALGLTPAGRSAKGGKQGGSTVAGKLDELRARREARTGSN